VLNFIAIDLGPYNCAAYSRLRESHFLASIKIQCIHE